MTAFAKVLMTIPTIQLSYSYFVPLYFASKFSSWYIKLLILSLFYAYAHLYATKNLVCCSLSACCLKQATIDFQVWLRIDSSETTKHETQLDKIFTCKRPINFFKF